MNLFNELKRRNVFKVAAAYMIVSWLILQIIGSIVPIIEAPDWISKAILMLLLAGFPIALLFAWAFELTPEGIKKESEVVRDESITSETSSKINVVIIGALVLIIGGFAYDKFFGSSTTTEIVQKDLKSSDQPNNTKVAQISDITASKNKLTLGIAVLPFENLSVDPNNAFFAGGVYEDVLTYLSRVVQWRVISRTSMEKIAERGMEITEIGKYLNVSHVLEGSVRRAGDRVRVTVQLIDASNDQHIWAENYDRKLEDIFAIQTEIAQKIAQQLKTELTPKQVKLITTRPTDNIDAYDFFIKARELARVWRGAEGFKEQIPLLEKAIALDPNFVEAEVILVLSYGRMFWTGSDTDDIYRPKAEALKNRILAKHPNSYYAYAAQGYYEYTIKRDYQVSLEQLQMAILERPDNVQLLSNISGAYKRLGKFEQSIVAIKKEISLNPESASTANELQQNLKYSKKIDEAFEQAISNVNNFPDNIQSQGLLAHLYFAYFGDVANYNKIHESLSLALNNNEWLYVKLNTNNTNIAQTILALEELQTDENPLNSAYIDENISELLNLNGDEKKSQYYAKKSLPAIKKYALKVNPIDNHRDVKWSLANVMYNSCLANDIATYEHFEEKFHRIKKLEILEEYAADRLYSLALAECGETEQAWNILKNQSGKPLSLITDWALALDPLYQHYFSEIPEYQAMVEALNNKKLKNN